MRAGGALAAAVILLACAPACGTPDSSFPAETECRTPEPVPTSRSVDGMASPAGFLDRVRTSTVELLRSRDRFAAEYPDDTFYRRDAFRPDMAAFADELICTAAALRSLESPIAGFDDWTASLHLTLDELISFTRSGREAVRSRNVSEYREFRAGLDQRLAAVERVAFTSP